MEPEEAGRVAGLMQEELNTAGFEGFDTMKVVIQAVGDGDASQDPERMQEIYQTAKELEG